MSTKKSLRIYMVLLSVIGLLLAGCSAGGAPRRIASFPSGAPQPPAEAPAYQPPGPLVYNASLVMRVWDPQAAAGRAGELAYEYGGYLVGSHSWTQAGEESVSVTLAVPPYSFDALRDELLHLGKLESESVWGERTGYAPGGLPSYSQISVEFRSRTVAWRGIHIGSWDPGRTLARALQVSVAIFGFLADILIWIVVVLGPFVLLAWAGWALVSRLRRKA